MFRGVDFDFRDPSGLIYYPVKEPTANCAHVLTKNYSVGENCQISARPV